MLARSVITEQTETTRIGLEFLQIGANKAALQELCDRKDTKYENALREFNEGKLRDGVVRNVSHLLSSYSRRNVPEGKESIYGGLERQPGGDFADA